MNTQSESSGARTVLRPHPKVPDYSDSSDDEENYYFSSPVDLRDDGANQFSEDSDDDFEPSDDEELESNCNNFRHPSMTSKYNSIDSTLHHINKTYVTLKEDDIKEFNTHFYRIVNTIIKSMKEVDPLFNDLYRKIVHCGSYYDGLKVHKPHEYDLNLVIKLPYNYKQFQFSSNCEPGFFQIIIPNQNEINPQSLKWNLYKTVDKWIHKSKLSKIALFQWMQGITTKALQKLNGNFIVQGYEYNVTFKINNPAMTLQCKCLNKSDIWFDVDLVPVIEFHSPMWLPHPFRINNSKLQESWYAVPKSKHSLVTETSHFDWRPSFQIQERRIIKNVNHLKPALRLLKKLRDSQSFQIASYYLKTIVLWEIEKQPASFWKNSLSYIFVQLLISFRNYMKEQNIPFYWNNEFNLVSHIHVEHLSHIERQLNKIIIDIDNNTTDGNIKCYILTRDELNLYTK